ncbi:MAG: dynamin family protein, partial [Campylobacter sp.]|nr:dynamin family protein [Campylobacter sp.]
MSDLFVLKNKYINYIDESSKILKNFDIDTSSYEKLSEQINQCELLIPVIGGFSAGKSTLLNSFLGLNILPTAISPETALATELRYDTKERIEAVRNDDSTEIFSTNEMLKIKENANDYKFLRLYLNNNNLNKISPLVLVDMPGFDSPVDSHNKAILNYLEKGIYFIVLIDANDGGITLSVLRELENINEYSKGFSFCISKTNLRPQSDIDRIKNQIHEQLKDEFPECGEIICLGNSSGTELEKILNQIDTKALFEKIFIDDLKSLYFQAQSNLNTNIATLKTTQSEADEAINELQNAINLLNSKKENEIENIKSKYSEQNVQYILQAVNADIANSDENLATKALQNEDLFANELNSIIKASLIRNLKQSMQQSMFGIIDSFSINSNELHLQNFSLDENWTKELTQNIKTITQKAQNGLGNIIDTLDKNSILYKIATIGSPIINSIITIILTFLPSIFGFIQQDNRKEEIIKQIHQSIIPSILAKLREILPQMLQNELENLINAISAKFKEEIEQKQAQIEQAKTQKAADNEQVKAQIQSYQDA